MTLRQRTLTAGKWTASSAFLRSGLQLLQTLVLAHLLTPADFGLMAVVTALLAIMSLFADLGLSRALIHYPIPAPETLSSLYWLNIAVCISLMLLVVLTAPALGMLFDEPRLVNLMLLTSLVFPLSAIGQIFRTLAEKALHFGVLVAIEIGSALMGFLVAVSIGWFGGGVYALAAGVLASTASSSLLARWHLSQGFRPCCRLRSSEVLPYLRFGGYLIGENLVNTLRMQADVVIAGSMFGPQAIGAYSLPRELCLRIGGNLINPAVTRVSFPVMATLQHDHVALKAIFLQTLRMTASINFPVYVALGIAADDIASLLLGSQWHDAGVYLRIFAAWGMIRSVGNPVGSLLHATGYVRLALFWNVILLALVPPLFWVGGRLYGLEGLAWAVLGAQIAVFLPAWRFLVFPACKARLNEYLAQIAPPFAATLVAGIAGVVATGRIEEPAIRLAAGLLTGATVYFLLSLWLNRAWIRAVFELLTLKPAR